MRTSADCLHKIVIVLSILWVSSAAQAYEFAGGTGEPNDPYRVATAEHLISIGSDPNLLDKHFVLLNDIDLNPNLPGGRIFTHAVIAADTDDRGSFEGTPFTGSFDGRGHSIRNLTIRNDTAQFLALFGRVAKEAMVRDLGMEDAQVDGHANDHAVLAGENDGRIVRCHAQGHARGSYEIGILVGWNCGEVSDCWAAGEVDGYSGVGGLVGINTDGVIVNSHATTRVRTQGATRTMGGGLVGSNSLGTIVNCYATGDVSAVWGQELGGLIGRSDGRIIVHCYATGKVSVENGGVNDPRRTLPNWLGGLVGSLSGGIHACYASGPVSGGDNSGSLGGLVGQSYGGYIEDSYAVGRVTAGKNSRGLGGLIGSGSGEINACFWDVETSGLSTSAGGTGLTTAQMQDAATFLAADWDWVGEYANGTVDPWFIREGGGYPMLTFQSNALQSHQLDGSGTADDPYRIVTAEDLGAINHYDLTACYRLEADVNLAGITWKESPIRYFNGWLDGAARTVFNLRVQGDFCLGLFGVLDQSASVMNMGIRDANIIGEGALGMLAGMNRGRIVACRANGAVSGIDAAGGLIGSNEGTISDSYAIGEVTAIASTGVGGLTGWNAGSISRCYAAAHVTSTVPVQGHVDVTGGLVGDNNYNDPLYPAGQVYDSCFLIDTDGGGPDNGFGLPLTDAQMRRHTSFIGWDFKEMWTICKSKDYPRLRWENIDCGE